jgi:hypothetical protein
MAYTLTADAANVTAGLTQLTEGGDILILTEMAARESALPCKLRAEEMPPASLKGRDT